MIFRVSTPKTAVFRMFWAVIHEGFFLGASRRRERGKAFPSAGGVSYAVAHNCKPAKTDPCKSTPLPQTHKTHIDGTDLQKTSKERANDAPNKAPKSSFFVRF